MLENCNLVSQIESKEKAILTSKKAIRVFFTLDEKLIILGQANNKQAYWFSCSDIKDEQTSQRMIAEASELEVTSVADISEVVKMISLNYEDLSYLYSEELDITENIFARYSQLKEMANSIDIQTERKLYDYLIRSFNRTDDPKKDFASFSIIIQKVRELKYLLLCDNDTVRMSYIELKKSCSEIIDRYKKTRG